MYFHEAKGRIFSSLEDHFRFILAYVIVSFTNCSTTMQCPHLFTLCTHIRLPVILCNFSAKAHAIASPLVYIAKMSDSESDSVSHVEQYDVEDNLNVYDSPMYEAHTNDMDTEAGPSTTSHVRVESTTSTRKEVSRFLFLFFFF